MFLCNKNASLKLRVEVNVKDVGLVVQIEIIAVTLEVILTRDYCVRIK